MEIVGIIAEYNPFHNGHLYQLQEIRKLHPDACVVVTMSGSLTQRGSVSCLNKWQRAASAVKNGADLIIELPCCFALSSAQYFAAGAIQLLHRLNVVKYLAFGAETKDLTLLKNIAEISSSIIVQDSLKNLLKEGIPYAAALSKALSLVNPETTNVIHKPNNVLAIEYLKELQELASPIEPVLIPRVVADYHSTDLTEKIASATAIRNLLSTDNECQMKLSSVLPPESLQLLATKKSKKYIDENHLLLPLLTQLRFCRAAELTQIYGIKEGLENVILVQAAKEDITSLHEFCLGIKSKRYSYTRLRRILMYILLHLEASMVEKFTSSGPLYCRILAFNENGQKIIRQIKRNTTLPIITRPKEFLKIKNLSLATAQEMLKLDIKATELQSLCYTHIMPAGLDYIMPPVVIK